MEKQRARNPEEKAHRKQSIVLALKELLLKSHYPLPSVNDIARSIGVSKGIIYFYFQSREEIYLTLHAQESFLFFEKMNQILRSGEYTFEKARNYVVEYFCENEIFMFLGLISPTIIESNVGGDFAREFKSGIAGAVEGLAQNWMTVEPDLDLVTMRNFIMRYYYLALMLWQKHHPPDVLLQAFGQRELWILGGELREELAESFEWLWTGMNAKGREFK